MTRKVFLICDRKVTADAAPGYRLRIETIESWLNKHGSDGVRVAVASQTNPIGRLLEVVAWSLRHLRLRDQRIIVACLGGPHMLALAVLLSRRNDVVADICDASLWSARGGLDLKCAIWRTIARALPTRRLTVSYISKQDADRDARAIRWARLFVLPPAVPASVVGLKPFVWPAQRLVIPADFSSRHNRSGFQLLLHVVERGLWRPQIPVHLYGPHEPDVELPPTFEFIGWADSLEGVYGGNSLVYAPNVSPGGIQNKVWESVWAGRPVLVGSDALGPWADGCDWVITFTDEESLGEKLRMLTDPGFRGYCPDAGVPLPPTPDLEMVFGRR